MKLFRKLANKGALLACGALLAGFIFSGCATTEEPVFTSTPFIEPTGEFAPATSTRTNTGVSLPEVRLQVGNAVMVTFSDTPEPIPAHQERIKEDGTITLPLIGAVKAAGKTVGELQKEIRDLYVPKYYVRLNVIVTSAWENLYYYVSGEVRSPGPKPYISGSETTVTKAISTAGGFTDFANKKNLTLTRANGSKSSVNYNKAVENPGQDPRVFPGDSINVKRSWW